MAKKQNKRIGELKTPLGADVLVLVNFEGTEELSELYKFEVEVLADHKDSETLDLAPLFAKMCSVKLETAPAGSKRYFAGIVTHFRRGDSLPGDRGVFYTLTLRPKAYTLSKIIQTRAFKNKTVVEILKLVLKDADIKDSIQGSFPTLEYVVQHNESDLDFARRLMESNGIHFHFEFGDGTHTMVLANGKHAFPDVPGGRRQFLAGSEALRTHDDEIISEWSAQRELAIGKVTQRDYDYRTPNAPLNATKDAPPPGDAKLEHYIHPYLNHLGDKMAVPEGEKFSQALVNAYQAEDNHAVGKGDCASFTPGYVVELTKHANAGKYLILRCKHHFSSQLYSSGQGDDEGYRGSYEFLPASQNYAPPLITPKPFISGPQTGRIGGDTEIDVDEFGRVLVWFHWNRENKDSESDGWAIRARVVQVWAHDKWGAQFIPRKGSEVIVHFIDGDPDRPIVLGAVYNKNNMPPFPMPAEKNTTGWKSNSTIGGGGYNEFSMTDTKGSELVTFQAQKDLKSKILNDETREVLHDRTTTITNDETLTVKDGNVATTVEKGNVTHTVKKGNVTEKVDVGSFSLEAMTSITLKVGTQKIVLDQTGITIEGMMITVDGKTSLNTKGGAMAQHESGGLLSLGAPMIKIN